MEIKPKIKNVKVYPKVRIHAKYHKSDYLDLEFREKGIHVISCTDNCGNEFFIPYEIIKGVLNNE
jgi:hypothetical protein